MEGFGRRDWLFMVNPPSVYANQSTPFQLTGGYILSRQELLRVILNKNAMISIVVGNFLEYPRALLQSIEYI
jgi:hypothetical protein